MTHHYTKRPMPSALREHYYGPLQALEDDKQWLPLWLWGVAGLVTAVAFVMCLPEAGA